MTAYWFLFALPALLALIPKYANIQIGSAVWIAFAGLLSATIGFRHEIGGDWGAYLVVFDRIESMSLLSALQAFEMDYAAYVAINWAIAASGLTVHWVNFVCGSLFVLGLVLFCRGQSNSWLALAVATPYLVIVIGMGFVRQSVAIAFEMLALTALMNAQWRRALVMILIAAAFHKTALWLLGLYAYVHSAMGARAISLLLLLGAAMGLLFFPNNAALVWHMYVTANMVSEGGWIRSLMNALPAVMLLFLRTRLLSEERERRIWIPLAILAVISLPLMSVASTVVDRFGFYLIPLQLFLYSRLPLMHERTSAHQPIVAGIVVLYGLVLFVWLNYSGPRCVLGALQDVLFRFDVTGKVIICVNTAWNLANFRGGLIRNMVAAGYQVIAVSPTDPYIDAVRAMGCRHVSMPMDNRGTHPGRDLLLFFRFLLLFIRERPSVFLGYTVKPNVFGSLAAHVFRIPVINNIAGLGSAFIKPSWVTRVVFALYRFSLRASWRVFFQNNDDRQLFIDSGLVSREKTDLLPGSGIDLRHYVPVPRSCPNPRTTFLLVGRMLWDKGVGEFVEAAKLLKRRGVSADFQLLGFLEVQNPTAISQKQVDTWGGQGLVRYLGSTDDVRPHLAIADCVVLPSYREGTPRSLLEAAAMARPIIATDAVGCRDVVDDGITGYLCRVRDANDLADRMQTFIELSAAEREAMGLRARAKVEREFDELIVIRKYLDAIEEAVAGSTGGTA